MSGSQIGGIIQILEQLSTGLLDKDAASALIASAFPTIPESNIEALVNGTKEKEQQPIPPQLGGPPVEGEQVEEEVPTEEGTTRIATGRGRTRRGRRLTLMDLSREQAQIVEPAAEDLKQETHVPKVDRQ